MNSVIFSEKCKSKFPNLDDADMALASRTHNLAPGITVDAFSGFAEYMAGYDEITDKDIIEYFYGEKFQNLFEQGSEFDNHVLYGIFINNADSVTSDNEGNLCFQSFYRSDRYFFDFKMDLTKWMQMDTGQDAPYYGNWCNPSLRTVVSYVEGDVYINVMKDDETFFNKILENSHWHKENDGRFSIDPGLKPCEKNKEFIKKYNEGVLNENKKKETVL